MKVKMLVISFLVFGFGFLLYGCSNKVSSYNSYPYYTSNYIGNHPKLMFKLEAACYKAETEVKLNGYSAAAAFLKTNLAKDCNNVNIAQLFSGYYGAKADNVIHSAPNRDSVLHDVPKP